MGRSIILSTCLLLASWTPAQAADPFVGRFVGSFDGDEYSLVLEAAGTFRYEGEMVIAGEPVPLVAQRFGDRLNGQVGIGGDSFEFSAEFVGNVLLLRDADGEVIRFQAAGP